MDSAVRTKPGAVAHVTQIGFNLTTMDTNTKVTNSPLASVNPTPAPCGRCSTAQSSGALTAPSMHLSQLGQTSSHVIVGGGNTTKPSMTHATMIQCSGLSALVDSIPHRLIPQTATGVGTTGMIREAQTLPRSMEQALHQQQQQQQQQALHLQQHQQHTVGLRYRPVLVAGGQTSLSRVQTAGSNAQAYHQMLASQSQASVRAITSQQAASQQQQQQQQMTLTKPAVSGAQTGIVLTGMMHGDGGGENSNAARIAHLLSPSGVPSAGGNTQLVVYYPQGGANNAIKASTEEQSSQQPTVYYAVATNDLLKQLQVSQSGQSDSIARPQLIQTPVGLVLVQPNASSMQPNSIKLPIAAPPTNPLRTPQTTNTNNNQVELCGNRQARVEAPHGPGLVCTCPPEVHQAIFEQQKRQKQQQQQQQQHQPQQPQQQSQQPRPASQDRQQVVCGKTLEPVSMGEQKVFAHMRDCQKPLENGNVIRTIHDTVTDNGMDRVVTPTTEREVAVTCPLAVVPIEAPEDKVEREAHVNYLVTLFQALKASGVQADSFVTAFKRTELPLPPTASRISLRVEKQRVIDCQESIMSLRQQCQRLQRRFSDDLRNCSEQTSRLLTDYGNRTSTACLDPSVRCVRGDRAALDRMLSELFDSKASLTEQLHDLECIIEQTGNDVLQHRCRITLPYVKTLEGRLDSINRAVSSTCVLYPEMRQRLSDQEEAEIRAIDLEKSQLDERLHQLEDIGEKCKRIKGTILTLRRLAIVNMQNRQQASSPRRFAHLGGMMNRAAADPNSLERVHLYSAIRSFRSDSVKRMQAIQRQETLAKQRKRVLALENTSNLETLTETVHMKPHIPMAPVENVRRILNSAKQSNSGETKLQKPPDPTPTPTNPPAPTTATTTPQPHENIVDKKAPLAVYSDDSLSSTTTTNSAQEMWLFTGSKATGSFNPSSVVSMIDETSDSTLENQPLPILPMGILKATFQPSQSNMASPKPLAKTAIKVARGVMFNTTVTVDDGSEVVRLNCTLDESELGKNRVAPTEKQSSSSSTVVTEKAVRGKLVTDRTGQPIKSNLKTSLIGASRSSNLTSSQAAADARCSPELQVTGAYRGSTVESVELNPVKPNVNGYAAGSGGEDVSSNQEVNSNAPAPPPRRSSQITTSAVETKQPQQQSPNSTKRASPLPIATEANELLVSPSE